MFGGGNLINSVDGYGAADSVQSEGIIDLDDRDRTVYRASDVEVQALIEEVELEELEREIDDD